MKKFFNWLRATIASYLEVEPEVQSEYVNKVVYLLRRDFDSEEQNEILLAIANRLSDLREKDLDQMSRDYANLQENTNTLKHRLALSQI
jgi:hypothetical protein